MGYEDENAEPLVLDIETMPRRGIDAFVDVPAAPANYKDEQKILDIRIEKLKTLLDRAALDIYLNQICCVGCWTPSRGVVVEVAEDLAAERLLLASLAVLISNNGHRRRIISFNGGSFDLPNLVVRARAHRLKFPLSTLDLVPKWRHAANDVMEVMTFQGLFSKRSLDFFCRLYEIDSDAPDEVKALNGADIPKLAAEGKWDLVAAHCRHDVIRTVELAKFAEVIRES